MAVSGLAGRKGDAAIAQQNRGHAMPADGGKQRVPADLGIQMGVDINKAGGDHQAIRLDHLARWAGGAANRGDHAAINGDIANKRLAPGPVHYQAAANDDVVGHAFLPDLLGAARLWPSFQGTRL